MKVYIAGPMTGIPDFNYPAFHKRAAELRASGYEVINPAENFNGDQALPYEEYIRQGIRQVSDCDAICLLPGWEKSSGVQIELAVARALKLEVFDHNMRNEHDPNSEFRKYHMYTSATGGQKLNQGKVQLELIPADALLEVARVMTYGAQKYAAHNWRRGLSWDYTIGSILRHVNAIMRGEDRDPETGLLHSAHAACQALFLTEFMLLGTPTDDRWKAGCSTCSGEDVNQFVHENKVAPRRVTAWHAAGHPMSLDEYLEEDPA